MTEPTDQASEVTARTWTDVVELAESGDPHKARIAFQAVVQAGSPENIKRFYYEHWKRLDPLTAETYDEALRDCVKTNRKQRRAMGDYGRVKA